MLQEAYLTNITDLRAINQNYTTIESKAPSTITSCAVAEHLPYPLFSCNVAVYSWLAKSKTTENNLEGRTVLERYSSLFEHTSRKSVQIHKLSALLFLCTL